jgi:hypothetical protein
MHKKILLPLIVLFSSFTFAQVTQNECDSLLQGDDFDLVSLKIMGSPSKRNLNEACYQNGQIQLTVRNHIRYKIQPLPSYHLITRLDTTTLRKLKHLYDTIIVTKNSILFLHKLFSPQGKPLVTDLYWFHIDTLTLKANLFSNRVPDTIMVMDLVQDVLNGKVDSKFKDWESRKTLQLTRRNGILFYKNESLFDLLLANFVY